jgi:hypothetical protein
MSAKLLLDLDALTLRSGIYAGRSLGSLGDNELLQISKHGAGARNQRNLVKAYCLTKLGTSELQKRLPPELASKYSATQATAGAAEPEQPQPGEDLCQLVNRKEKQQKVQPTL